MKDNIIVYFSAEGTTKKVATSLQERLNGDIFEIVPKHIYSKSDLNWKDKNSITTVEFNSEVRPEIASSIDNLDQYQNVYIGFPIWWYIEPRIIDTFLDKYHDKLHNVYFFATSGGSTIEKATSRIKNMYKDINIVKTGTLNNVKAIDEFLK